MIKNKSWFDGYYLLIIGILVFAILAVTPAKAQTDTPQPIVRVLLFWMDGCPHCHHVIDDVLPPLKEQYGNQLEIRMIEVETIEDFDRLIGVAAQYSIHAAEVGVPFLIINDKVLIGSDEIAQKFPDLIEKYIDQGGIDWPTLANLDAFSTQEKSISIYIDPNAVVHGILFYTSDCYDCNLYGWQTLTPLNEKYSSHLDIQVIDIVTSTDVDYLYQVATQFGFAKDEVDLPLFIIGDHILIGEEIPDQLPALIETYLQAGGVTPVSLPAPAPKTEDVMTSESPAQPEGFGLAIGTMIFMASTLVYTLICIGLAALRDRQPRAIPLWQDWAILLLALIGLGVAGYLAYVETKMVSAVCGPVGDCNTVQSSPYARLFGVLPIGVLGMIGYLGILLAWGWGRFRRDTLAEYAPLALYGMSFVGTLFSLYLTYLEPFVIRAVCMWCISSAIIITLLLLLSLNPILDQLTWDEENDITTTLKT